MTQINYNPQSLQNYNSLPAGNILSTPNNKNLPLEEPTIKEENQKKDFENIVNKFIRGHLTPTMTVKELQTIGAQVRPSSAGIKKQLIGYYVTYQGKRYSIYCNKDAAVSSTDAKTVITYTEQAIKNYKFNDETIKKYFDVVYDDKAGNKKYALKANSEYINLSELVTSLFNDYKNDYMLKSFLEDKQKTEKSRSGAVFKKKQDGTTISKSDYSAYINQIGIAKGEDAEKLKKEAFNKIITDFTSGNLTTTQASSLLQTIGIKPKFTTNNKTNIISFEYENKKYTLRCNQAAASKAYDNETQTTYTKETLDNYQASNDLIEKYFTAVATEGNVDIVYILKDGMTIKDFEEEIKPKVNINMGWDIWGDQTESSVETDIKNVSSTESKWMEFYNSDDYKKLLSFLKEENSVSGEEITQIYNKLSNIYQTIDYTSEAESNLAGTIYSAKQLIKESLYKQVTGKTWNGNDDTFAKDILKNLDANYDKPPKLTINILKNMDDIFFMSNTQKDILQQLIDNPKLSWQDYDYYYIFDAQMAILESEYSISDELYGVYDAYMIQNNHNIDDKTFEDIYNISLEHIEKSFNINSLEGKQEFLSILDRIIPNYEKYKNEYTELSEATFKEIFTSSFKSALADKTPIFDAEELMGKFDLIFFNKYIETIFSNKNIESGVAKRTAPPQQEKQRPEGLKTEYKATSGMGANKVSVSIPIQDNNFEADGNGRRLIINTEISINRGGNTYTIPLQCKYSNNVGTSPIQQFNYMIDKVIKFITVGTPHQLNDFLNVCDTLNFKSQPYQDKQKPEVAGTYWYGQISLYYDLNRDPKTFYSHFYHEIGHAIDHKTNTDRHSWSTEDTIDADIRKLFEDFKKEPSIIKLSEDSKYPLTNIQEFFAQYYAMKNSNASTGVIGENEHYDAIYDSKLMKKYEKLFKAFDDIINKAKNLSNQEDATNNEETDTAPQANTIGTPSSPTTGTNNSTTNTTGNSGSSTGGSNNQSTNSNYNTVSFPDKALQEVMSWTQTVDWNGDWSYGSDGTAQMPELTVTAKMPQGTRKMYQELYKAGFAQEEAQRYIKTLFNSFGQEDVSKIIKLIGNGEIEFNVVETYAGSKESDIFTASFTASADQMDYANSRDENGNLTSNYAGTDMLNYQLAGFDDRDEFEDYMNETFGFLSKQGDHSYAITSNGSQSSNVSRPVNPSKPSRYVTEKIFNYKNGRVTVDLTYSNKTTEQIDITNELTSQIAWQSLSTDYDTNSLQREIPRILQEYVRQQNILNGNLLTGV